MRDKLRILHAPTNIANQMTILSKAQRVLGYSSYSCTYSNNWFNYKSDQCLNLEKFRNKYHRIYREFQFFVSSILKYNVFHFHFGRTLLPRYYDLPWLKALNKKMVMHYWGSEVRQKSVAERNSRFVKVKIEDEKRIVDAIKRISKYIDIAIVGDYELYEYVQDYFKEVTIIRQAVDLEKHTPVIPSKNTKKPVIVHAPSDKDFKGTRYVLEAVDRLEKDHELEFILVHGVPHYQAKETYQRADIVVDQLLGGTHGVFAVEAMALGKPVICYIREDLKEKYPKEMPIISANPENIYDVLKLLVEDAKLRHNSGGKGRAYVEKYHDAKKISKELIDLYGKL